MMTEEMDRNDEAADAADAADATGGGAPGEGATSPATEVADEVQGLRDELGALNDRHLRLAAEFDNYRKRNERDRQSMAARLQSDLVGSLLDVLDDLHRVAASEPDTTTDSVLEGVRLVEKKFMSVLEGAGLEPLDAEGAPFDPEVMEALMTVPTDDPEKDHYVADVFQRGYRFRDTLLRPARVRVLQYDDTADNSD
jgi:molecular chaperone GrpE